MSDQKQILMVAANKPVEALRMASGLTLLDDPVRVVTLGQLPEGPAVDEQMEALDFSDVPVTRIEGDNGMLVLAAQIVASDVVYWV